MSWWRRLRGAFEDLADDGPVNASARPMGQLAPGDEPDGGELPRVPRFSDPARPGEPTDVCTRHMPRNTGLHEGLCGVCGHHGLLHPGWAGGTLTACVVCQLQDQLAQP